MPFSRSVVITSGFSAEAFRQRGLRVRDSSQFKQVVNGELKTDLPDTMVMSYALRHNAVLVTQGVDMLDRALFQMQKGWAFPHRGMIIIQGAMTAAQLAEKTEQLEKMYQKRLDQGCVVIQPGPRKDGKKRDPVILSTGEQQYLAHYEEKTGRHLPRIGSANRLSLNELKGLVPPEYSTVTRPAPVKKMFERDVFVDSCIPVDFFREKGYRVFAADDFSTRNAKGYSLNDMGDEQNLRMADRMKSVMVTADADYLELAARGHKHQGILIVMGSPHYEDRANAVKWHLEEKRCGQLLNAGYVVVVENNKIRATYSPEDQKLLGRLIDNPSYEARCHRHNKVAVLDSAVLLQEIKGHVPTRGAVVPQRRRMSHSQP